MERALLIALLTLIMSVTCTAFNCYNCINCANFEGSPSVACGPGATHCVKIHTISGEVSRQCGSEAMCKENKNIADFTSIYCCSGNNCNLATKQTINLPFVILTIIFLVNL